MTQSSLRVFALAATVCLAAGDSLAKSGKKPASGTKPAAAVAPSTTAAVGDAAPTVELPGLNGEPVDLAATYESGNTVLVVLRGYPGYQCGICSRQVTKFFATADEFADAGYQVVMVYPGGVSDLDKKAAEFLGGKQLPAGVTMLLDPEYKLIDAYGLRWDAPRETAYPSTFIVKQGGQIAWAKISQTHAGRASAKAVLKAIAKL